MRAPLRASVLARHRHQSGDPVDWLERWEGQAATFAAWLGVVAAVALLIFPTTRQAALRVFNSIARAIQVGWLVTLQASVQPLTAHKTASASDAIAA